MARSSLSSFTQKDENKCTRPHCTKWGTSLWYSDGMSMFVQASRNHSLLSYYLIFSIYKRGRVFTRNRGNGLHRLNITTLLLSQFATWVKSKHDQSISHGPIGTIVGKRDFASLNQIYEFSGRIFRIKFPCILAERVPTFSQLWLGLKWTVKVKSQTCIRQCPRYKILPSGLCAEICCNREKRTFR